MATYDLEEQEQLAELKLWWKRHGNLVLSAVSIVLIVLAAWNGWKLWQHNQSSHASILFSDLQKSAKAGDTKKVSDSAGSILEQYPRTTYAPLAALISAKAHFESGDMKTAKAQLQWVVSNARDAELQDIARLRLAALLIDEKNFEEALRLLDAVPSPSMASLYAGMRGDVFLAQGKTGDARTAYKNALEKTASKQVAARELLQLKLDVIGTGQ